MGRSGGADGSHGADDGMSLADGERPAFLTQQRLSLAKLPSARGTGSFQTPEARRVRGTDENVLRQPQAQGAHGDRPPSILYHLFLRSSLKGLPGSLPGVVNGAKPPCFYSSLRGHPSPGSLKR